MRSTKRESSPDLGCISNNIVLGCVFMHMGMSLGFALDVVQG